MRPFLILQAVNLEFPVYQIAANKHVRAVLIYCFRNVENACVEWFKNVMEPLLAKSSFNFVPVLRVHGRFLLLKKGEPQVTPLIFNNRWPVRGQCTWTNLYLPTLPYPGLRMLSACRLRGHT